MSKKESKKPQAIALLEKENSVAIIAKKTGLTPTRIYQIKRELEAEAEATETDEGLNWVKEQLRDAMSTLLDDLKNGRETNTQSVDSLLAVAGALVEIYDRENPDPNRIGMGADANGGQVIRGTTTTRSSFVERLGGRPDRTGSDD